MNNFAVSLVRTVVPVIVGSLIGLLVTLGIDLPADAGESLTIGIQALAIALYYLGARWLEQRWPIFGYLLGTRAEPVYVTPGTTGGTAWQETPAKVEETNDWVARRSEDLGTSTPSSVDPD